MTVSLASSLSSDPRAPSRLLDRTGRLSVWPRSTRPEADGDISVSGVSLTEAAYRLGTPVYVLDEQEVRERCRAYRTAFPEADVVYAAKAFLCRAVAHWVMEEGLGLECAPPGSWRSRSPPASRRRRSCCTATPRAPRT